MGNDEVLRLSYGRAGEHGEKVAAAKGEDAGHYGNSRGTRIDDHAHIIGKFVFISAVNIGNRLFGRVAQGTSKLRRLEPRLIVAGDGGEGEIVEAERLRHGKPLVVLLNSPFQNRKRAGSFNTVNKNGPYTFPLRVLYNGWTPGPNTGWMIHHFQDEKHS